MHIDTDENEIAAEVADVVEHVVESAVAEVEGDKEMVIASLESAQHRLELAEDNAEQIAAAAMESHRGQEIEHIKSEFETWREQNRMELAEIRGSLENLNSAIANLSLSTPPVSEVPPPIVEVEAEPSATTVAEMETIDPAREDDPAPATTEPEPEAPRKRRRRWM